MNLVKWPNPILNQVCQTVTEFDRSLKEKVDNMFMFMYTEQGLGLSANQVGLLDRITVIDTKRATGGTIKQAFINPVITMSEGKNVHREGCLSFPGVYVSIPRFDTIAVEAQNLAGETFTVLADGIDAICLQHEIDHLNGITFYDRLGPVKRKIYDKKFNKLKRK